MSQPTFRDSFFSYIVSHAEVFSDGAVFYIGLTPSSGDGRYMGVLEAKNLKSMDSHGDENTTDVIDSTFHDTACWKRVELRDWDEDDLYANYEGDATLTRIYRWIGPGPTPVTNRARRHSMEDMPNGTIPKDPSWCVECRMDKKPCEHHVDRDGNPMVYAGQDAYTPSSWVLGIVGKRWRGMGDVYLCTGFDPRCGFWMRQIAAPHREANISTRVIGRTYHRIRLTLGAWVIARTIAKLGRLPTKEEAHEARASLDMGMKTLRDLDLVIEKDGVTSLTEEGQRMAAIEDFFLTETTTGDNDE